MKGGYCEVGRGGVNMKGEVGRRIEVQELEFVRDSVVWVPFSSPSVHGV